jgi:DNA-binding CsgD family transcriptional regulator
VTLLERGAELEAVDALLAGAAAGRGGVLVVEGPAGVGKTALLDAAAARAAGLRVLRARGSELDRAFAFGVVRGLLERVAEPELLTGGAEGAAPVLATVPAGADPDDDGFRALHGLYWLVANLAGRGPLALLVDDLQWVDAPSLRWLAFLAGRVDELPVAIVLALRPGEPGADDALLDVLAGDARVLRPRPLTETAVATLVRDRTDASAAFVAACHRASGGNPFLLGELLGELAADDVHDAERVFEFGPDRVGRAVRRRLRALPPEATALARALAVLGDGATLADAAALAGLGEDVARTAADALAGIDVLNGLEFVHPVVRAAVREQIAPLERERLHAAAASSAGGERAARHLLEVAPAGDPARVEALRSAARDAAARGAPDSAARYLERALAEPPPAASLGAVLHELGVAEATARRPGFDGHLRAAAAATADRRARARVALDLGRALAASGEFGASVAVLDAALEDPGDDGLAVELEAELLTMSFNDFAAGAVAEPRWRRRREQLDAGEPLAPATRACVALGLVTSFPPASRGLGVVDRVLAESRLDELNSVVAGCLGNALIFGGRPGRAARFYDGTIAAATARGSRLTVAWQSIMRSDAALRLGEVRRAEADARAGLDLLGDGSGVAAYAWALAHLVRALTARGALDEADAALAARPVGADAPPSFPLAQFLAARSELRLAQGESAVALQDARAAGDIVGAAIHNPACSAWRSAAGLAAAAAGRRDEAIALAADELASARRFAIPAAVGAALRTCGVVAGDLAALQKSVAVLEGAPLEHARSLLELGAALRRGGERTEARAVLRSALDLATRTGATATADRAHEELVAAGARPRRDRRLLSGRESLTAGEDRVAVLAAEGHTNREIAVRLFVTVKAVQWHLRNAYRKLDVASREELAGALDLPSQDETLGGGG